AGLKESVPLLGSGFLTDGTLQAQGDAATGVTTTLHYADGIDNPVNNAFREAYNSNFGKPADIYAVQGYDAGKLLVTGLDAVGGDTGNKDALIKAMSSATIDSPRGAWTFSPSHNPAQNVYVREVQEGENRMIAVAAEGLADPGTGCKMNP
ncbi:MAG: ABC transporter substrate-binding protein, partial [Gammaproteobacteria bacterium]|nr:ABC transporter substrate-binding protein [Gammaproteobacteria bacterium]